jgi:hypothetical protein
MLAAPARAAVFTACDCCWRNKLLPLPLLPPLLMLLVILPLVLLVLMLPRFKMCDAFGLAL